MKKIYDPEVLFQIAVNTTSAVAMFWAFEASLELKELEQVAWFILSMQLIEMGRAARRWEKSNETYRQAAKEAGR